MERSWAPVTVGGGLALTGLVMVVSRGLLAPLML
jgi:hypothetical protein